MTHEEIQKEVEKRMILMDEAIASMHGVFTLNPAVRKLNDELAELREECSKLGHVYEDNFCIYCAEWRDA